MMRDGKGVITREMLLTGCKDDIEAAITALNQQISAAQDLDFYVSVGITTNGKRSGVYLATIEGRSE